MNQDSRDKNLTASSRDEHQRRGSKELRYTNGGAGVAISCLVALILLVAACTGTEGDDVGSADSAIPEVDEATALAACAPEVEPVPLGTSVELPFGARVVVNAFETGLTHEMQGTELHYAVADVELCAGDELVLDAPFTNEGTFNLCRSETWQGETTTAAYPPSTFPKLREPTLAPGSEEIPLGECRRGWVTFQTGEEDTPVQLHAVVYDTSAFTDYPDDQVRFVWSLDQEPAP